VEASPIRAPKGMHGFVFNARRARFADPRVREALGLVFDFAWVNRNLYHGRLRRSRSYFDDSDLSSAGRPADEASARSSPASPGPCARTSWRGPTSPPGTDGSGRDREAAARALELLERAGLAIRDGRLRDARTGEPFGFEILAISRQQERLALNYAAALARIGVEARIRLVDDVQFWRRLSAFDFDMVPWTWAVSASPGSEQRNRWGAAAADRPGSLNLAGAREPAVDAMIDAMLAARTREEFAGAVRALDRVLLSGFHVVPLFYLPDQWIAYDARLAGRRTPPCSGAPSRRGGGRAGEAREGTNN
jgi:peptide/nickel transport system substrate-binding protein